MALSSDGNRLAVGAPYNDNNGPGAGHVRLFDWDGSQWAPVGSTLLGEASGDLFGWSLALSSNGNRLAVGALYHDDDNNGSDAGQVRVFDWDGQSQWTPVGPSLRGEASGDLFGSSVALSSDGNRLAVGAPCRYDGSDVGHVRLFDWDGQSQWVPVGPTGTLVGQEAGDLFGWSVALSSDGTHLAVGAPYNNDNGPDAGHVRVYDLPGR